MFLGVCFLICFGIYPVWYFLTSLGLWFSFCHSNDTLFGSSWPLSLQIFLLPVFSFFSYWYLDVVLMLLSLTATVAIYVLQVFSLVDSGYFYFSSCEREENSQRELKFPSPS